MINQPDSSEIYNKENPKKFLNYHFKPYFLFLRKVTKLITGVNSQVDEFTLSILYDSKNDLFGNIF